VHGRAGSKTRRLQIETASAGMNEVNLGRRRTCRSFGGRSVGFGNAVFEDVRVNSASIADEPIHFAL
jgi:hypothetical protein